MKSCLHLLPAWGAGLSGSGGGYVLQGAHRQVYPLGEKRRIGGTGRSGALKQQDPLDILAYQYDIVCNGVELSSGNVRNHDMQTRVRVFAIAGYDEKALKSKFGALYQAFQFGTPPHAGMALGWTVYCCWG